MNHKSLSKTIEDNYNRVREKMCCSLQKAGRKEKDCLLLAVTKYATIEQMQVLMQLGHRDFGESRVQDAEKKISLLSSKFSGLRWHMIGHLQTNKIRKAVKLFHSIQTADSEKVISRLQVNACELQKKMPIMFQVNVTGEKNKSGASLLELSVLLDLVSRSSCLELTGLMTIPPYFDDPQQARPVFQAMKKLQQDINRQAGKTMISHLSMGMSHDYEIAIEEGATIVRVGSALFEK